MMRVENIQLVVSGDRTVSAILMIPDQAKALLVLAHGAGAGMDHVFMKRLAEALAENEIGTLRYNFLYMEEKKKRPDVPALAHSAVKAAIEKAHALVPELPVFAGGKSFGGRMTSQYAAKKSIADVNGIIFFGFPLHPSDEPAVERADHLIDVKVPMLFLQGTKDKLAYLDLITGVCGKLPEATLQVIEKADHAFYEAKKDHIPGLALRASEWMKQLI